MVITILYTSGHTFFSRKILPVATYFIFNPASEELNIRRWVLSSQCPGHYKGEELDVLVQLRYRSSQANYISLGLAEQRCSCTMGPLLVKKLHKKGSAPSKGWQAEKMWVEKLFSLRPVKLHSGEGEILKQVKGTSKRSSKLYASNFAR